MSYSVALGSPYADAWTPDQDSVISGFTDASIYASLQRQPHRPLSSSSNHLHHLYTKPFSPQTPLQHQHSRGHHSKQKNSLVTLRNVNARPLHKRG
ncbi:hypothetical protein SK128_028429, partial [Halocaridina rubra]